MENSIRLIVNEKYKVDEYLIGILEQMAAVPGVCKPVVALPDIHYKPSYHTPTGVIVLAKDRIIPKFVNPNCGMSFIVTPFYCDDMPAEKLDIIFEYIKRNISVSMRVKPVISISDLKNIIKDGALWSMRNYNLDPGDMLNFENGGSLFSGADISKEEILSFIPNICRKTGLLSMGVLGFGNHFIEMQKAEEIIDDDIARRFSISRGQICFMIHGDSRGFGGSIYDFYSKKAKKLLGVQQVYKKVHYAISSSERSPEWSKSLLGGINYYGNRLKSLVYWKLRATKKKNIKFPFIDPVSHEGVTYKINAYAAINYAYANRAYIAAVIRDALRAAFDKDSINIKILCDGNHDSLQEETIGQDTYWVHRNGASRALPPKFYKNHPIFNITGQPVLIPSSLGNPSFLCAAREGCPESYYSSSHGTGRLVERAEARDMFKAEDVLKQASINGLKIYDYGKGMISEESPKAFKDIYDIIETIKKYKIATPVAKLKPLAVLKGWL